MRIYRSIESFVICSQVCWKKRLKMGVSHSNKHDRSCPLDGEGEISILLLLLNEKNINSSRAHVK